MKMPFRLKPHNHAAAESGGIDLLRPFKRLFIIFSVIVLASGMIVAIFSAGLMRRQLILKCMSAASTVAVLISEDSDGYAAFLKNMNTESAYYQRVKTLLMKLKQANLRNVNYLYTSARADENTMMYVLDGEDPAGGMFSAPGKTAQMTEAERRAYDERSDTAGNVFVKNENGWLLSVCVPIVHKDTGEPLGMAVANVTGAQYGQFLLIYSLQTIVTLLAGLAAFAHATRLTSGKTRSAVNHKLSEMREAEEKLATENEALDRMNRLKNELMTTISHEARTPLAVLSGYASLVALELRDKGADEQTTADLDNIVVEAMRVADLIDSMKRLAVNSCESTEYTQLDFTGLVTQIASLYKPILKRSGVILNIDIKDRFFVSGNKDELTQVFFNVLQNAKNHTETGSVTVSAERESSQIKITVSDTGTGIPPEILPRIFERGISGRPAGMGVGLAVSKEIMEKHGGTIQVRNNPHGKGTVATLTLPEHTET
ncbi:MAG: HAMP domain-containing histidine kinase [Clostridiales bacterium]|jgi:signal transduction histidine kinase|nr:HAMP domain-containing histidine kinase [Clostridiales bacterium]